MAKLCFRMLRRRGRKASTCIFEWVLITLAAYLMCNYYYNQSEAHFSENFIQVPWNNSNTSELVDWHLAVRPERKARDADDVVISDAKYHAEIEKLMAVNGYNGFLSDKLPLDRPVPDLRHEACKKQKYPKHLPNVSVIVTFHDEHLSTLLRTATSVVNRSPPHLLVEVILADDFSRKPELHKPLEEYIKRNLPKVKVVRTKKREGLIRGRNFGASYAKGSVLVFLDAHSEVLVNWLPPLITPIKQNKKVITCPFIDVIEYDSYRITTQDNGGRGSFDWELLYKRISRESPNPTEPFDSPVMAGGYFAADREWFWTLGGYDPGLDIWGGEQYELSFKTWMCGGKVVDTPCSRVAHIYRKFAPFPNPNIGDFVARNLRRVAEVWMDDYKEYLYRRRPHYRRTDPGDITQQQMIRKKLKCKSFDWFMKEVAYDQPQFYAFKTKGIYSFGYIYNIESGLCVTVRNRTAMIMQTCCDHLAVCDPEFKQRQSFELHSNGLLENAFITGIRLHAYLMSHGNSYIFDRFKTNRTSWSHNANAGLVSNDKSMCLVPTQTQIIALKPCTDIKSKERLFFSYYNISSINVT